MGIGKRIGNLYISLGLNTTAFNKGFTDASKALEQFKARTEKNKLAAFTNQIGLTTKSIKTLESTAKMAMGTIGAGIGLYGVKSLIDISDKYTLIEGRLRLVTKSTAELASVQASLYQVAQRTRTDFSATADLYTSLARSTQSLGLSQSQLLTMVESVNKALIVSGASSESSNAALIQLGQGMASGVLRGEELNSVLEQTPRLAQMIADGMGITIGQLRQYGKEGKLTAETVAQALISQADSVDAEFSRMGTTVGQAMTELRNAFESVISDANSATGSTQSLAGAIQGLARTVEQNKPGIIAAFEGIASMINWAVERLAAFGNAYALFQKMREGKISVLQWATASNEDAKALLGQYNERDMRAQMAMLGIPGYVIDAQNGLSRSGSSLPTGIPLKPTFKPTGGGGSSSRTGNTAAQQAEREALRLQEQYNNVLEDAIRWFRIETEVVEGSTAAYEEWEKSMYNAAILKNRGNITEEQYNDLTKQATIELAKFSLAAQNASVDLDSLLASRPEWFGESSSQGLTDRIASNQGIDALRGMESLMSYSGIRIAGWDKFEASYTELAKYFSPENQAAKGAKDSSGLYKGLAYAAAGIGEAVGGTVGNALSSTVSMALAGLEFGGPVGAVIGGAVGLVSSLFGGDSNYEQEKAQRDDLRRQIYDNMISSALSGGTESLKLLKQSGYDYDVLKNLQDPGYPGMKSGTSGRLFEDRGVEELEKLQEALSVLDQAGQTMSQFSRPSMLADLDTAANLLEYSIAQVGDLAELTAAYQAQQIMIITGLNADVIGSFVTDAVSAGVTGEAGKAFSEKFEASIAESIRQMAISNLVTNSIMPVLQPALTALVSGLTSGTMTASEMASLYENVKTVTSQISPMVTALTQSFEYAGIGVTSGTNKAISTSNYSSYAEYALASAGVPAYAAGGSFAGGWRIVGEYGPELEYTGPSRIYSNSQSRGLVDFSRLESEIAALRADLQASNYAIAKNTAQTAQWLEKWEKDGLPKETTV